MNSLAEKFAIYWENNGFEQEIQNIINYCLSEKRSKLELLLQFYFWKSILNNSVI